MMLNLFTVNIVKKTMNIKINKSRYVKTFTYGVLKMNPI